MRAEIAALCMEHLCEHDWHGYTQGGGRWGDGEGTCPVETPWGTYRVEQGDRDCSSAVISCWQAAGVDVHATYTGDMLAGFLATGLFEKKPASYQAQRGDIYLNYAAHTAMCLGNGLLGEFSLNEFGGIVGGAVGDQTGRESSVHGYYSFPWDCVLHYIGEDEGEDDMATPGEIWSYQNSRLEKVDVYQILRDIRDNTVALKKENAEIKKEIAALKKAR